MLLEEQILEVVAYHSQGVATNEICKRLGKTPQELGDAFEDLIESGQVLGFAGLWLSAQAFDRFATEFLEALESLHNSQPATILVDPGQVAANIEWRAPSKALDRMTTKLAQDERLFKGESGVRLTDFRPILPYRTRDFLDRVKTVLESEPVSTPNPHRISQSLRVPLIAVEEVLKIGVEAGEVVQVDDTVFYTEAQVARIRALLSELTPDDRAASVVRDRLATTRKYAVALLRHLFPRDDNL